MMLFRRAIAAIAAIALSASAALAQGASFPAGTVWGNDTAAQRPGKVATLSAMLDRAFGSTRGAMLERGASTWGIIAPGAVGLPYVSGGAGADPSYVLLGITGGGTGAATLTTHGFIIGAGTGPLTSLVCSSAQLAVGQTAADPICRTLTGDVSIDAAGATTVTSTFLNAAHTWGANQLLTLNQNNPTVWDVSNNSAGVNALAGFRSGNGTGTAVHGVGGTGITGPSANLANRAFVYSTSTLDGIAIFADGAKAIRFYTNNTLAGTFDSSQILTLANPLAAGSGGQGRNTLTANAFLTGNGTSPVNMVAITGLVLGNGASAPSAYAGTSCTNQFARSLSALGVATCATVALATDVSGTLQAAQAPAFTGDVISSAGSLALAVARVNGVDPTKAASILTGTSGSVAATDGATIFNPSGTFTATLPTASAGRMLYVKTVAAFAVNSASSNVIGITGGGAGTGILTATSGKWAILQADGTNWIIMANN